jgi:hypothetical protein
MMRRKRLKHEERNAEEDEDVNIEDNSPAHSAAENNEKKDNVVFSQMAEKAHGYTAD